MGNWSAVEELDRFRELNSLTDEVWQIVSKWDRFPKDTVGKQLVRAIDSIGANMVEGDGRYHYKENLNFFYIARASLRESIYWLQIANRRSLIRSEDAQRLTEQLEDCHRWINALIKRRRDHFGAVGEEPAEYDSSPPLAPPFPVAE
jgi:four helix bundle protein